MLVNLVSERWVVANTHTKHTRARAHTHTRTQPLRWCILPPDDTTLRLIFWHGYCQARAVLLRPDFPRHVLPLKPIALESSSVESDQGLDENAQHCVEALSRAPIHLASDATKRSAVLNEAEIRSEIQRRVDVAERKWTGCMGCVRSCAVAVRLLFPCCPLVWCVQPLVLGGRYTPEAEKVFKKVC